MKAVPRSEWEASTQMLTPASFGWIEFVVLAVILFLLVSVALRLIEMRSRLGGTLSRIESKLDLLLRQAGVEFDPYANLPREIADAARAGQTIQAIKLYRQFMDRQSSGVGLREAKDFIEDLQRRIK